MLEYGYQWVYAAFYTDIIMLLIIALFRMPLPELVNDHGLKKEYSYSKVLGFLFLIPITYISASRTYFIDTIDYMRMYKAVGSDFSAIDFEYFPTVEKGYLYFTCFLNKISSDPQILFIITSIVIYVSFIMFIYKNCCDVPFALMIFMCQSWTSTMNGMRQFFAAAVTYLAWNYWAYSDKKWKKHIVLILAVLIAMQFHKSAIIVLLVFYMCKGKLFNVKTIIVLLGSFVIFMFPFVYDFLFEVLLSESDYANYENVSNGMGLMRFLVGCVPIVLVLINKAMFKYENDDENDISNWMMNVVIFNFCCSLLSLKMVYFARLATYFGLFSGVMVPNIINKCFKGKSYLYIKVFAFFLYIIYFLYQMYAYGDYMKLFDLCFLK